MNAKRFVRRAGALVLAAGLLAACESPTGGDGHDEPDVAGVAITVGPNTVALGPGGQSGTLSLATGISHTVTIRAVDFAGADDPVVAEHADEYEIRITQAPPASSGDATAITRFTQAGTGYPFTGTITTGAQTGQAVYRVALYATEHGHEEWFAFLTLTVTAGTAN